MSASVVRGFTRAAWGHQDWASAALLLAPSAIMYEMCLVHVAAVGANVVFHAFMLVSILGHGWSLFHGSNEFKHREGSLAGRRATDAAGDAATRARMARLAGGVMFAIGMSCYVVCRALSSPDEYLGVNKPALRQTLDDYGVSDVGPMVVFAGYFSLANPWLEEIFWRQLLRWRLRLAAMPQVGNQKPTDALRVAAACRHADALSAVAYSAYHSVIISSLMPPWFNLGVAFPFLAFMGHLLNRIADHPKLGVRVCCALHTGLDAATAFWILDIRFGWLDPLFP